MMRNCNSSKGFTLIELLISISLGIVAVSAIMFFYLSTITSSYTTLKNSKLNQETASLLSIMVNDIRRAGFGNLSSTSPYQNAFSDESTGTVLGTVLQINDDKSTVLGSCITFAYDLNVSGGLPESNEYFGYRLKDNQIEMRTANVSCNSATGWEPLTDSNVIKIVELNFDLDGDDDVPPNNPSYSYKGSFERKSECFNSDDLTNFDCFNSEPASGSGHVTIESRYVIISLQAELAGDSELAIQLERGVIVKNHHVKEW